MSDREDIAPAAFKAALETLKAELRALDESSREARAPVELDQQAVGRLSRMDALQGQAMALEQQRRRANEVKRIDAALARLADGEFGYCVTCGEEIGLKRLDLDPATPTCVDCAGS